MRAVTAGLVGLACLVASASMATVVKTYTTNGQFDDGTFEATENDTITDQIQLIPGESETLPFLYIANHRSGTISKVNTDTGNEVARYPACVNNIGNTNLCPSSDTNRAPNAYCNWSGRGHCPSRTTVDLNGDIWIANRAFSNQASVTKIAGELGHCIDRNGDGVIQTSTDLDGNGRINLTEPPAHPSNNHNPNGPLIPIGPSTDGEWQGSADECVMFSVPVGGNNELARALSIDGQNRIWVGMYNTGNAYVLDNATGGTIASYSYGINFYGFANDALGYIYNSELGNGRILQINATTGAQNKIVDLPYSTYGLAVERDTQRVWLGQWSTGQERLIRVDFASGSGSYTSFTRPGTGTNGWNTRGSAVANDGKVWVAYWTRNAASYLDTSVDPPVWGPLYSVSGLGPIGIAIDSENRAWSSNYYGGNATRFDPVTNAQINSAALGVHPYSYSDMSGYQLTQGVVQQGSWTVVNDGGIEGLEWGTVHINEDEASATCHPDGFIPANTKIIVEARWNETPTFAGTWTQVTSGQEFTGQTGRYMQVRARLRIEGLVDQYPVLTDMRVLPRGPSVTGFNPSQVPLGFSGQVEIQGANFTNELAVDFGPDIEVTNVVVNSVSSAFVSINVPAQTPPGFPSVTVDNTAFPFTSTGIFEVTLDAPTLTSVAPQYVAPGSTTTLTFSGTNLPPSATEAASAGSAANHAFTDLTSFTTDFTAPAEPQLIDWTVTTPAGSASATGATTVYGLTFGSGDAVEQGASGTLTINGVGFQGDEVFDFGGGVNVVDTDVVGNTATLTVFATSGAPLGFQSVTVTSPSLGLGHNLADVFEVIPPGGVGTPTPPAGCTDIDYQGRPYRVCTITADFAAARAACQTDGMDLVAISHAAENAFVQQKLGEAGGTDAWIGLQGTGTDYSTWTTGQLVSYASWAGGSAPTAADQCLHLEGGQWTAGDCATPRGYICEGSLPSTAPELIGLWYFNDGEGAEFADASGNDHTGTLLSPYAWLPSELEDLLPSDSTAQGAAVRFEQGGFGEAPVLYAASSEATIEAWFSTSQGPVTPQSIIELGPGNALLLSAGTGGQLNLTCQFTTDDGLATKSASATAPFDPNFNSPPWNHVACVYNGTNATLYRNGLAVAAEPLDGPLDLEAGSVELGGTPILFDNVAYWSVALDPTTLQEHAQNGGITNDDGDTVGLPAPAISTVSPQVAGPGQALTVTLNGANFTSGADVSFGPDVNLDAFNLVDANNATADISVDADGALGNRNVNIRTPFGTATLPAGFKVFGVTSIAPPVVQAGQQDVQVQLTGYGFSGSETVSFGQGVTTESVNLTGPTTLSVTIDVDATAVLGSRDLIVLGDDSAEHILTGVFTVAGSDVIVWTTEADFANSQVRNIDLVTKPGSVFLAESTGSLSVDLTSGDLEEEFTLVNGEGIVDVTKTPSGLLVTGFGGGAVQTPLPSGDFELDTQVRVSALTSDSAEVLGFGPPGAFQTGQRFIDTGYSGLFATSTGALGWYKNEAGQLLYWTGSAWTTSFATFSSDKGLSTNLDVSLSVRDFQLTVVVHDADAGADLTTITSFVIPASPQFYLGSKAEFSRLEGEPQFGTAVYGSLSISDPHGASDDFDGPSLSSLWTWMPGQNGAGGSASATGGLGSIASDAGGAIAWPLATGSNTEVSVRLRATGGGGGTDSQWVSLAGFFDGTMHTGPVAGQVSSGLYIDQATGQLAYIEHNGSGTSWWDGAMWQSSEAYIPDTAGGWGAWVEVTGISSGGNFELNIFNNVGQLLTSIPTLPVGGTLSHFYVGAPAENGADGMPQVGSVEADWFRASGDIQGFGFADSGQITIGMYDAGEPKNFGSLSIGATIPAGTSVEMRLRTGDDLAALAAQPFLGPDGSTDPAVNFTGGEVIGDPFDGKRYIQWLAVLRTTDSTLSPEIQDIIIPVQELPSVTSIVPGWVHRGQQAIITINGTQFDSSTSVVVAPDGNVVGVNPVSQTAVEATVAMPDTNNPGPRTVTVSTSAGDIVVPDGLAMAGVLSTDTNSAEQGQTVAIQLAGIGLETPVGSDFGLGTSVGTTSVTNFSTLDVSLQLDANALLGPRDIAVSSQGSTTSLVNAFEVFPDSGCSDGCETLTLTDVNPPVVEPGASATITLTGSFFGTDLVVAASGGIVVESYDPQNANLAQITLAIPSDFSGSSIDLTLSRKGQSVTATGAVKVLRVDSVSTSSLPVGTTTVFTVLGSGFDAATGVSLTLGDSVSATPTVVSETELSVSATVTASAVLGPRDLNVNVGVASAGIVGAVEVHSASGDNSPDFSTVTPNSGQRGESYNITIAGQNFSSGTIATFGAGMQVSNLQVVDNQTLTLTLSIAPLTATGSRDVSVTTLYGQKLNLAAFLVQSTPCDGVVCNAPPGPCFDPNGTCDVATGDCDYVPLPAGATCDDGIVCTAGDQCDGSGNCGAPSGVDCNDGIPCTTDYCDPIEGCINEPGDENCAEFTCRYGGDIDGNGKITVGDAMCTIISVLSYSNGGTLPACIKGKLIDPIEMLDANCDSNISVSDSQLVISVALSGGYSTVIDHNQNNCVDACDTDECGDGFCQSWESCKICPEDCGDCPGDCAVPHATFGCNNADVMNCVCLGAPSCCVSGGDGWTQACVDAAAACP